MKTMKKIAIIIANQEFRDEEYFETKVLLEKSGLKTTSFSNEKGLAIGRFGGEVLINNILEDLNINDFDGILFVGGSGAIKYLDNEISYQKIREAYNRKKLVAAICIAPLILFHAGVLEKATVWSSSMDKTAVKELGDVYVSKNVVKNKNIITADGPESINDFSNCIIKYFTN